MPENTNPTHVNQPTQAEKPKAETHSSVVLDNDHEPKPVGTPEQYALAAELRSKIPQKDKDGNIVKSNLKKSEPFPTQPENAQVNAPQEVNPEPNNPTPPAEQVVNPEDPNAGNPTNTPNT